MRNSIIVLLCFSVICMAIGFTIISMRLEKNRENNPYFDVVFTKVTEQTAVKGGSISPHCVGNIINDEKEVSMNCNLYVPHDELSYSIVIKNNGNMDALIVDLMESPDYVNDVTLKNSIEPISITHNDISKSILKPGEELTLKVFIKYKESLKEKLTSKKFTYNLSLITASPSK